MNSKTIFVRYLIFLCGFFLVSRFYLPAHYNIPYPAPLVFQFSPDIKKEHLKAIEQSRPELVLVGDSVLERGVDADLLSARSGVKSYAIYVPGSGTASWYLVMKNIILKSAEPPKYIAIVFRNTMLTVPQYRTTGRYQELLDDYASKNEPLLMELAFISQMNPIEKFSQQYIPLYSARLKIREELDSFLRYLPTSAMLGCDRECTNDAIKSTFGREVDLMALTQMMEDAAKTLYDPEEMNFERQVADSFLPYMIQLAQENNVNLIFIRTGIVGYEPPALEKYTKSLDAYLSKQDHVFLINFDHDPRIKKEFYYNDGLHFNEYGKAEFTKMLADELIKVVKDNR